MPQEIYLLKVGMTMTEGVVDEWYIADGQAVVKGQPIYRLETEKVNMDVEAESDGIVKHLEPAGKTLEPGDVVGWLYAHDEVIPDELPRAERKADLEPTEATNEESPSRDVEKSSVQVQKEEKPPARKIAVVPAARRLARELDVDLSAIVGTGPRGRITKEDVEKAAASSTPSSHSIQLKGMRKIIADRMFDSLQQTAQLTMDMEVVMDRAIQLRSDLNELWTSEGIHITYTDLVLKAVAIALTKHPRMNASLLENEIQMNSEVNLGMAVALEEGLIVPVIKDASNKSLKQISRETNDLSTRARSNNLQLDEVSNGTFTVTSLGMFGVDTFTPILNRPQTGILGVGRIYE
ncbi:MAG: dihydrolipoamide acetyltransferase family protein, partial [Gammaproteobacteria bacterium]|nr:dihydrolipoamide acetyltransferase family protein [Gammaproteobacteria bacterium]